VKLSAAVSVIIPAYRSHATIAGCLTALHRQTDRDFEVVVVDSSPDERTAEVVRGGFPEVIFERSAVRLLPHAARNRGVELAGGGLLIFTDPDVYADAGWLAALRSAHRATGQPVVGALACHGSGWLDTAIHICKFSKWLPGGSPRPIDMGPTAALLVRRETFDLLGGFSPDYLLADALFSWEIRRRGALLWFEPGAVVEHHHHDDWRSFLRERFVRGVLFGDLRAEWSRHGWRRDLLFLAASLSLARLPRVAALMAVHCARAGMLGRFLRTAPLSIAGQTATLLGEARAYARRLVRAPRRRLRTPSAPSPAGTSGCRRPSGGHRRRRPS
jgi:GT2 family glycosyltransferase